MKLELTDEFRRALDLLENSARNVFVTGRAGTGKSTLLQHFRSKTRKNVVVLAPTGVAAVNAGGETIHSFLGFKPNVTLDRIKKASKTRQSLYKKIDTLVIDEVSMVRADLLDCVSRFLELNGRKPGLPFGGGCNIGAMVWEGLLTRGGRGPVADRTGSAAEGFYRSFAPLTTSLSRLARASHMLRPVGLQTHPREVRQCYPVALPRAFRRLIESAPRAESKSRAQTTYADRNPSVVARA